MALSSTNSLIMEPSKSHLDSSTLQGAVPFAGPPRSRGLRDPTEHCVRKKQNKNKTQNPGVSKNCCNCLYFLKVCVSFSLPLLHPDILGPRLDLWAQNWFPCSFYGLVPPTKTMDLFFPIVKGPCVWPQEFHPELVPKLTTSCSVPSRSPWNPQARGVE